MIKYTSKNWVSKRVYSEARLARVTDCLGSIITICFARAMNNGVIFSEQKRTGRKDRTKNPE